MRPSLKKLRETFDDFFVVVKLSRQLRKELKRHRATKRELQACSLRLRYLILCGYNPEDVHRVVLAEYKARKLHQHSPQREGVPPLASPLASQRLARRLAELFYWQTEAKGTTLALFRFKYHRATVCVNNFSS